METSRRPMPDLIPIRSVLRNVRQVMRDQRDRMETDVPAILPRPASKVALHLLRDLDFVVRGVDGILSDMAHHVFREDLAKPAPVSGQQDDWLWTALVTTARRLQVRNPDALLRTVKSNGGVAHDAEDLAGLLVTLQAELKPDEVLALFAACLSLLAKQAEERPLATVTEPAADLTRALGGRVHAAIAQRDPKAIAALLSKYAAHV